MTSSAEKLLSNFVTTDALSTTKFILTLLPKAKHTTQETHYCQTESLLPVAD